MTQPHCCIIFGNKICLNYNGVEHKVVFPQLFVNKDTSVHHLLLYTKKRPGTLVLVEQVFNITYHV